MQDNAKKGIIFENIAIIGEKYYFCDVKRFSNYNLSVVRLLIVKSDDLCIKIY